MDLRRGRPALITVKSDYGRGGKKVSLNRQAGAESGRARWVVPRACRRRDHYSAGGEKVFPVQVSKADETFFVRGGWPSADGTVRQGRQNSEVPRFPEVTRSMDPAVTNCARRAGPRRCGFRAWQHQGQ